MNRTSRPNHRPAFTMIDALSVVVALLILLVVVLTIVFGGGRRHNHYGHPRDASATRALMQGFALWAGSNQDRYPLPSLIDTADATVPERGAAKNTTANVFSLLIFNSYFPPELLISEAEVNPNIKPMEGYQLEHPSTAVDPSHALWDPALRADFTGSKPGNVSFAHMFPEVPEAAGRYGPNQSTDAVVGNRGPEITSIAIGKHGEAIPTYAPVPKTGTNLTFLIHGQRDKWEGYIGYADNHVNFETRMDPEASPYRGADGKPHPDCLFFEEPDAAGHDNFLGIFIKAGAERKDFKTIWD